MALQVDIALDDAGTPHVVWVEDDGDDVRRVYYTRKVGTTAWQNKEIVGGTESRDSEGPAITYANGFVHVAWTEWTAPNHQPDSEVRYCRWTAGEAVCDQLDVKVLATRFDDLLLARNPTIAADRSGNVYVVWDQLLDELESVQGRKTYAIGYAHSGDNGDNWRSPRTYLEGYVFGTDATPFVSGDGQDYKVEYVHYLRPHISLVTSATTSVPVLGWHAEFKPAGSIDPGLAQVAVVNPHKVFWTYATEPGSDVTGRMYWKEKQGAPHFMTLSTDLCGEVAQTVDSATGRLAPVGDLNEILAGESSGSHLHAVYHEETGGGLWGTFYNNNGSYQCHKVNLPVMLRNTLGGG